MNRKIILMSVIALTGLAVLIAGCGMNQQAATDEETLVEVTVSSIVAKTIEPNVVMDITTYDLVYGISGSGTVKTKTGIPAQSGATTVYLLLSAGTYNFTINGYNGTDLTAIGRGTANNVKVSPKNPTPVSILVGPVTGKGSVNVTVDWTAWAAKTNYTLNASFVASVFAWNANLTTATKLFDLTPAVGTTSASLTGANIDNGYYKCRIQMFENGNATPVWSTVDALRVVSSFESVETYALDRQLDGSVVVGVTKNLENPLAVDLNTQVNGNGFVYYADNPAAVQLPEFFLVPNGTNFTVEAWPKKDGVATSVDSFEWYIDGAGPFTANGGENLGTSYSVFIAGTGFSPGSYTLSVLVTKDTTVSSRNVQFIILEP